ncbi:uncharacterized protein LOC120665262 [Panicum virgatum]|uniref:F-box domain-containing protein n=1 Tax=Panicum virgatum TaxID=38727 RepID=A0A8T0W1W9_PANVG|nr:uncharacterized protein LOC120665262 [Panicum virgatum]KAG2640657.1 hypothetical protein PVAP13_2KG105000 [Panicum virgatum]
MGAPPPAGALMEELVEEIRLPPAKPESLARAALVCKSWCRLISSPRFRRRLREFHRTPPMLGLICNRFEYRYLTRFVPTWSFRPRHADRRQWRALDARHGRVLLHGMNWGRRQLVVWDPVTDDWSQLPMGPRLHYDWNAAVLCAACATGACDQLDCFLRPFLVVFFGTGVNHMTLWVYSSEVGAWSEPTSVVQFPRTRSCTTIMTMEDAGLGVARMEGRRLSLWSMEANLNGSMGWAQIRAIDLVKLLSDVDAHSNFSDFVGFAHGVGIFFVGTDDGLFSFDLKSGLVRKVCEGGCHYSGVIPYMSFYTPALGAVSTGD